ncbi:hypothetical protein D3C77_625080 [compost metagenome]
MIPVLPGSAVCCGEIVPSSGPPDNSIYYFFIKRGQPPSTTPPLPHILDYLHLARVLPKLQLVVEEIRIQVFVFP